MKELKIEDLKNDVFTGELIRFEYVCMKNYNKNLQETERLLTQMRLYKKSRKKIFS